MPTPPPPYRQRSKSGGSVTFQEAVPAGGVAAAEGTAAADDQGDNGTPTQPRQRRRHPLHQPGQGPGQRLGLPTTSDGDGSGESAAVATPAAVYQRKGNRRGPRPTASGEGGGKGDLAPVPQTPTTPPPASQAAKPGGQMLHPAAKRLPSFHIFHIFLGKVGLFFGAFWVAELCISAHRFTYVKGNMGF